MPRAELALPAAAAAAGVLVLAPFLTPYFGFLSLVHALPSAAAGAPGVPAPRLDIAEALSVLAVDPELRAGRALYDAALRSPQAGRAVLAWASQPDGSRGRVLAALEAANILLARSPADPLPHSETGLAAAAAATGVDLIYLRRTAAAESSFNPFARARTSTARGLFQFIEQTWLRSLAKWGARHGRAREAQLVRFDRRGRAYVNDPAQAKALLALRYDPDLSARMAAELARENAAVMAGALGRPVQRRELYAAHLLGVTGALRLIRAAHEDPNLPAAWLLPDAAARNRALFYHDGAPRSAGEFIGGLSEAAINP